MYYGNNEWSEKGPAQCDGRIGFGNSVPDILLVLRVLRFDIGDHCRSLGRGTTETVFAVAG